MFCCVQCVQNASPLFATSRREVELAMSRWDAAARAVPPPADPRQRQVVEKLAEFRARNGEAFVDVVRSKQSGNPLYAFLDAGREDDPVAKYYLQCVEARGSGPADAAAGPRVESSRRTHPTRRRRGRTPGTSQTTIFPRA